MKFIWQQYRQRMAQRKVCNRGGFTLMELLVGIAVFVIFMTAISIAYVSIVRGHGDTNQQRKMIADVRYFMDFVTDHLRDGTVDYDFYCVKNNFEVMPNLNPKNPNLLQTGINGGVALQGALQNSVNFTDFTNVKQPKKDVCASTNLGKGIVEELVIVSRDQQSRLWIKVEDQKIKFKKQEKKTIGGDFVDINDYQDFEMLNTRVASLKFVVGPLDNPYKQRAYSYAGLQFQPRVTVLLNAGIPRDGSDTEIELPIFIQTTLSSRVYSDK